VLPLSFGAASELNLLPFPSALISQGNKLCCTSYQYYFTYSTVISCLLIGIHIYMCLYTLHREAEFRGSDEPCERMLEDLSLERRKVVDDSEASSARYVFL
jgi:hypothetical protein